MPYELWNIAPPILPLRSRLYSLAPMGSGTPQVECLTSYMMRLADAHAVSLGTLVRREIFPHIAKHPKRLSCAALHSLNGLGSWFVPWVETLESLTGRRDLRALTLLPWQGVFGADGILRKHRAWCSRCYQEHRDRGLPVYDFLLWMVTATAVCPQHENVLEEFCPHCRKRSRPFLPNGRPGFCSHCGEWLGRELPVPLSCVQEDLESRIQTEQQIADLLSHSVTQNQPLCSHLLDNLERAIAGLAHGNRLSFCRVAGINERTLIDWLERGGLPSLALLLRLARNLRIPLKRLLTERIPAEDEMWIQTEAALHAEQVKVTCRRVAARQRFEHPVTRPSLWMLSSRDRIAAKAEVKAAMETELEEEVPRSVRDIFRRQGYRYCVMGNYWFPDLYAAIQFKRKMRSHKYQVELERALKETPPSTVTQVAQRLGVSINCIRTACPALYRQVLLRRPDRQSFEAANTVEALKKAFDEEPASLTRLAERLHRNPNNLRMTYPELCAGLRQRYIAHQSAERRRLDLIYEAHARSAIDEILATSKYPSRKRVLTFITQRNPTLTSICLTGRALRRIRLELAQNASAIQGFQVTDVATIN